MGQIAHHAQATLIKSATKMENAKAEALERATVYAFATLVIREKIVLIALMLITSPTKMTINCCAPSVIYLVQVPATAQEIRVRLRRYYLFCNLVITQLACSMYRFFKRLR